MSPTRTAQGIFIFSFFSVAKFRDLALKQNATGSR